MVSNLNDGLDKHGSTNTATGHHCPEKYKGDCRKGPNCCKTHQEYCHKHRKRHLKSEPCPKCQREEDAREREAAAKKTAERKDFVQAKLDQKKEDSDRKRKGRHYNDKKKDGGGDGTIQT